MAHNIVLVTQGQQQYMKVLTSIAYRRGYSPYIDENGFWTIYDDETHEYVTTELQARGEKGDQGDKGEDGEDGMDYVLQQDDYVEIAALIDEHTYTVEKTEVVMGASVSNDVLTINFGNTSSPTSGAVEVATDVTVNTE